LFSYDVINNVLPIIAGAKLQRFLHPTKFSADYFLIAELFYFVTNHIITVSLLDMPFIPNATYPGAPDSSWFSLSQITNHKSQKGSRGFPKAPPQNFSFTRTLLYIDI
jgi:hypothetical protein